MMETNNIILGISINLKVSNNLQKLVKQSKGLLKKSFKKGKNWSNKKNNNRNLLTHIYRCILRTITTILNLISINA